MRPRCFQIVFLCPLNHLLRSDLSYLYVFFGCWRLLLLDKLLRGKGHHLLTALCIFRFWESSIKKLKDLWTPNSFDHADLSSFDIFPFVLDALKHTVVKKLACWWPHLFLHGQTHAYKPFHFGWVGRRYFIVLTFGDSAIERWQVTSFERYFEGAKLID